tara:strand:- start:21 stop:221 length:201 start_codon:yes stop_codon:yes gene_type:complete
MEGCFDVTVDSRGREECTADYTNVQRFADLIIRECAELSTGYTGNVKMLIMNHFGMEPDALAKGKK